MLAALRGSTHFSLENVGEPTEYPRCLPLPCFNKFVLTQKNFNCFVHYKTIPTLLCKDRRWCLDERPMFWSPTWYWSRPMLFAKVENRRIITFYFKISTVDVGECIQPQQHWSKQRSKVVTPQERLLSIIQFLPRCFVVYIICQWNNKLLIFFTIYHLPVSLHSFYFNTGRLHWHSNLFATYFVYFNKALPFFVTLPTPFLITFLLTRQVIE